MKTKFLLISLIFTFFLTSFIPGISSRLQTGEPAPQINLTEQPELAEKFTNKNLVLHFWSPDDPASRIDNRLLAAIVSALDNEDVRFVSVCTSDNEILASEILKNDNMEEDAIYLFSSDVSDDTFRSFKTDYGHKTYLISSEGIIEGIGESAAEIKSLIGNIW